MKSMLFLSRKNAARSQMAEGLARHLFGPGMTLMSAGLEPGKLQEPAAAAMAELGIDIRRQEPKAIRLISPDIVDLVIVLDSKDLRPPSFLKCNHLLWPLPELPYGDGANREALPAYRCARDELAELLSRLSRAFD